MHSKNKVAFIDLSYQRGGTQKTFLYHILNFQEVKGYVFARKRSIFSDYTHKLLTHGFKTILTPNNTPFSPSKRLGKIKLISPSQLYLHLSLIVFLKKHLTPDIKILIGSALFSNIYAHLISKLCHLEYIAHLNDYDLISTKRLPFLKKARCIITVSQFLKDELLRYGIDNNKICVIYPPIYKLPKLLHKKNTINKTIGFIGRLTYEKGIHIFLDILEKRRDLYGIVAGELSRTEEKGEIERRLQSLIDKGRIKYIGYTKDIYEVLSSIDILIYPSVVPEGFGRTILEALMTGTPVIGSQVGAIPEVLDGIPYTAIVPPRERDFNNAIENLLSQNIIPEKIRKYALNKFPPRKSSLLLEKLLIEYLHLTNHKLGCIK